MNFLKKIKFKILRIKSFKKICFSRDLYCWTVFDFLNEMDNAFHNVGAATEKHLSPKEVNLFSTSSHEGNLVVIHHLIAADRQIDLKTV